KDPRRGALGAVAPDVVRAAVQRVAGRRQTSAVCGDLPMDPAALSDAVTAMAATGVNYVKVGLFPDPRREDCIAALAGPGRAVRIVGVIFADRGADNALIGLMAGAGVARPLR